VRLPAGCHVLQATTVSRLRGSATAIRIVEMDLMKIISSVAVSYFAPLSTHYALVVEVMNTLYFCIGNFIFSNVKVFFSFSYHNIIY